MNGDPVTGDRCDKNRAEMELKIEHRVQEILECFTAEIKTEVKDIKTAMQTNHDTLSKKIDSKNEKVMYLIVGWVITVALLIISNAAGKI